MFEAEIVVQPGDPAVVVTVDDNFVDHLDVEVDGNRLDVGFEHGNYDPSIDPTVVITVPTLDAVDISGAVSATVDGVDGEHFAIEVSGASDLVAEASVSELDIEASGASEVEVIGFADEVDVDVSGASEVDLGRLRAGTATLDASGASDTFFDDVGQVEGSLSGTSTMTAGPDTTVSVSTSGASNVELS